MIFGRARKYHMLQKIPRSVGSFWRNTRGFFQRRQLTFKDLFIIENIILLTIIASIVIYEYYIIDRSVTNLTTQNKLTATSIIMNLLMAIF